MRCTYLSKSFLFSRVVKRWCARNNYDLTNAGIYTLFALIDVTCGKSSTIIADLQDHLKRNKHTMGSNIITGHLTKLEACGLVEKSGKYPVCYRITIQGLNAINNFETALKKARTDR